MEEIRTYDSPEPDYAERLEEQMMLVGWGGFVGALIGTPFIAFLLVMYGLMNGSPYPLIAGIAFACLSIMLTVRYFKAYGGETDQENDELLESSPRFYRRI